MAERIVVIGAGRIGNAVASTLRQKGVVVDMWDEVPSLVPLQKPLDRIIPSAAGVILCIPSWATRACAQVIRPLLSRSAFVLSFAKGIEQKTLATVDIVLAEELPHHVTGVIGGPMMAEEVLINRGGIAFIGVQKAAQKKLQALFDGTVIRTHFSADVHSVALAGTLKNVYAFALGLAHGARWGDNMTGWLASRSIKEMMEIMRILRADETMVLGPAGIGDFVATAFSPNSRNRSVGQRIFETGKAPSTESTKSLVPLCALVKASNLKKLPILAGLCALVAQKRKAQRVIADWEELSTKTG